MLDIHSHVLPGVDDGAADMQESTAMLRAARAAGVTGIIATPHRKDAKDDPAHIREAYEALRPVAAELGMSLYLGYEYHYRLFLDGDVRHARAFCLADSSVLLLEFSTGALPLQWENTIYAIQQEGMDVIIAHPERYASVQADVSVAERMAQMGCELQIDVESLDAGAGSAERRCARLLISKGLASWIASDAHHADAYDSLAALWPKYRDRLKTPALLGPQRAVHSEKIKALPVRPRRTKRLLAWILTGAAALGIAAGSLGAGMHYSRQAQDQAAYESLAQLAAPTPAQSFPAASSPPAQTTISPAGGQPATPTPAPRFAGWYADYASEADREIDFEALKAVNPDIYAWISVEGAGIDYPVVHMETPGDPHYLDYDVSGDKNAAGAIYTDGFNNAGFSDPNTLVYGHNMKDGSMFTALQNFEDARFFEENRKIKIYLPDGAMLTYEVFAAYRTGHNHILAENNFFDPEVFVQYTDSIFAVRSLSANIRPMELTAQDRIITLVTCVGIDDRRLFVQGVLTHA